jgi:hypothetical protein
MDSYIGNRPISDTAGYRHEVTASAGQTTFSLPYAVGFIDVFVNGAKLGAADFVATNGTTVVLASPAESGDLVSFIAWAAGEMLPKDEFVRKAGDTMTGDLAFGNNDVVGVKTVTYSGEYDNGDAGAAKTITLTNGQKQKVTLSAATTLTIDATGAATGHYQLRLIQNATGGWAVTWSGISATRWLGSATAPAVNLAANGETIVTIFVSAGAVVCASMSKVGAA